MKFRMGIWMGGLLVAGLSVFAQEPVRFDVQLTDPVKPDAGPRTYVMELVLDENGFPFEYRLFLKTDVCLDRICKMLEATLVWDALGYFQRIEYADQTPLTKNDHDPFFEADYKKLNRILKDRNALVGANPLEYFLVKPDVRDDIDGVTAATPDSVKDAVVGGAAYSTWTIWHWANGEVVDLLEAKTRSYISDDFLVHCLNSENDHFVRFAFAKIKDRKSTDVRIGDLCLRLLETGGEVNCRLSMDVMGQDAFISRQADVAEKVGVNPESTRMILEWLQTLMEAEPKVWAALANQLELLDDQQDLKISLSLLSAHASSSELVREKVEELLGRNDPILNFRVKKFLSN